MTTRQQTDNTCAVLIKLRLKHEYSKQYIQEQTGIERTKYGKMESGDGKLFIGDIFTLAAFYKMKPSELVALIENPNEVSQLDRLRIENEALIQEIISLKKRIELLIEI